MVNWQLTAKTMFCDAIAEEVTVMVYKDGSIKCTGFNKYSALGTEQAPGKRSKEPKREIKCDKPECALTIQYRDALFAGEASH